MKGSTYSSEKSHLRCHQPQNSHNYNQIHDPEAGKATEPLSIPSRIADTHDTYAIILLVYPEIRARF